MSQGSDQNWVLCSYFTFKKDPQRNFYWDANIEDVMPLINSVISKGVHIKLFHDCFDDDLKIENCEFIRVKAPMEYSPAVARWFVYYNYLVNCNELPRALFMVDSTDVLMLNNPFSKLHKEIIYTGSENKKSIDCKWLEKKTKYFDIDDYKKYIKRSANKPLLNAGICGGETETVILFLEKLCEIHNHYSQNIEESLDMPMYNYIILKFFPNYVSGEKVHTKYKKYEVKSTAWWKHK